MRRLTEGTMISIKMKKKYIIISMISTLFLTTLVTIFIFSFFNKENKKTDGSNDVTVVKVGIMNGRIKDDETWQIINQKLKPQHIQVELKRYEDYNLPNKDLEKGVLDLNAFQHKSFLDDWNKKNNGDLVPIGETYLSPLRLYSSIYKDINQIPDGTTIRVPNDTINQSRGLKFLENLGLITFKPSSNKESNDLVSVKDILTNRKNFNIQAFPVEQLLAKYGTGITVAITTDDYAKMANLSVGDVISVEKINSSSKQWVNVVSARKNDKNNPIYKKIIDAYQTPEVAEAMEDEIGRYQIPAWKNTEFNN